VAKIASRRAIAASCKSRKILVKRSITLDETSCPSDQDALTLAANALPWEEDPARRKALDDEQQRLITDGAREQENEARAPKIHAELDQDRMVRPRLLPGMTFVPRKPAGYQENGQEGDAQ